jgi:hypothetical protein
VGTIIQTDSNQVERMLSQARWQKTKENIEWIREQLSAQPTPKGLKIPHKPLESIRGFLVYVSRTYPKMTPYLKGIHLTLDSWRVGQARSGWKEEVANQESMEGQRG